MRTAQAAIAVRYRRFAAQEAAGVSPLYAALAEAVADHQSTLARLARLPVARQQPNLLFAAFRWVAGLPQGRADFFEVLDRRWEDIHQVMLARAVQINEPGRCAALVLALAQFPEPIALIDAGASAGLCLLPDRYRYDYGGTRLGSSGPVFACTLSGPLRPPTRIPRIVWRAGLDLNPLSLASADETAWLETLVWPEQTRRRKRLRAAIELARADPPRVVAGDLRTDLTALIAQAPADATVVVWHSAVLSYLPSLLGSPPSRHEVDDFAALLSSLACQWVSSELPHVLPPPPRAAAGWGRPDPFVLSINGRPVALSERNGEWLHWLAD